MKPAQIKLLYTAIKTICCMFLVCCLCLFLLAFKTNEINADLWTQLGIKQSDANINIRVSVTSNYLQYAGAKNAKNIVAGKRPAVINQLVAYAKKFTASAEFKKEYAFERSKNKPKDPMLFSINVDSIRNEEKQRVLQSIKQTEANANNPNPKIKNAVPARLEALKKELVALDDPNNKKVQAQVNQLQSFNDAANDAYKKELDKFNTKYPENAQVVIKKRLQQILDITADVDYNAELKQGPKYKVFVNPEYQKKSREWKLAYRSGKVTTDAVRAAAEKWLAEFK
ncbi:MAG: hypothetical protein ACXWV9_09010 [Flavisolibacter sp.]